MLGNIARCLGYLYPHMFPEGFQFIWVIISDLDSADQDG